MADLYEHLNRALEGRYRVESELGRGGMAVVFLAHDIRHDRHVALKVMRPELSAAIGFERFAREIRMAAGVQHPHIVPVFDSGDADGLLFYVMPYVEGETLRERLEREKQLPVDEALAIARMVAEALTHAHGHALVHRDIKPENILLTSDHAVVTDFGLARAVSAADHGGTDSGIAVGTPSYMSPEQAGAEPNVDARADVYGLGCVLFEMLAGDPPFSGPTAQAILARQMQEHVPSVRVVRPGVSRSIERALERALAKAPADRYQSAKDFGRALQGVAGPPRWVLAASLGGGAVLLVAAALFLSAPSEGGLVPQRVVVSAFENASGDPALNDAGTMAADWITQGLQQSNAVEVVPTPTALQAWRFVREEADRGRITDPVWALARETGAGIVISGSIYRTGSGVRIHVQVTDAARGRMLDALEPELGSTDSLGPTVARLRDRLMGFLAVSFDERLGPTGSVTREPPTFQAYREFANGMRLYIRNEFEKALPHFYEAYDRDSSFVLSLLYAALNHSNLGEWERADSLLAEVDLRRDRLTDYDRQWLEYRQALLAGDRTRALVAIREAARLAPGSKAGYNHAVEAYENGRLHEALAVLESIEPERGPMRGWFPYWGVLGSVLHMLGRSAREVRLAEQVRQSYPDRLWGVELEVAALAAQRRPKEAVSRLRAVRQLGADITGQRLLTVMRTTGEELWVHGARALANEVWNDAYAFYHGLQPTEATLPVNKWEFALVATALGRFEVARAVLDTLLATSPDDIMYRGLMGVVAARLNDRATADRVATALEGLARPHLFGEHLVNAAFIRASLGDREAALGLLQGAFADGRRFDLWLHRDFRLAPLRDAAAFRALLLSRD